MSADWWSDEDAARLDAAIGEHIGGTEDAFDPHSWRCYDKERYPGDCSCKARLRGDVLTALTPTVERIRREAKAEALREAADEVGAWGPSTRNAAMALRARADRIEAGDSDA